MRILAEKKCRCPRTNRKLSIYKCDDGIWRSCKDLVDVSELTKGTRKQQETTIRNRIQNNGYTHPNILGPEIPRGRKLDGSKIKKPDRLPARVYNQNWQVLSDEKRIMNMPKNGKFDDLLFKSKPAGIGGAKRYLGH